MRKLITSLVVTMAAMTVVPAVASADRYYVGKGDHSVVGIRVDKGQLVDAFVVYRSRCTRDGDRSGHHRGSTRITEDLDLASDGGFKTTYEQTWSQAAIRDGFQGRITGGRADGAYRSRFRHRDEGAIEKCRSGRVRFDIGRSTRARYEREFEDR